MISYAFCTAPESASSATTDIFTIAQIITPTSTQIVALMAAQVFVSSNMIRM